MIPDTKEVTDVTSMRRGLVIGNCQSLPLSGTLNYFCSNVTFDYFGVHVIPPAQRAERIRAFVNQSHDKFSIVLAAPLSDDFDMLSSSRVRATFAPAAVFTIPNFYFSGLHPDLTYLGSLGRRLAGPLHDYHSKLAVAGYVNGIPPKELKRYFSVSSYEAAGYFGEYANSLEEMRRRDREQVDIGFAQEIEQFLRRDLCFFSFNHPTSFLFGAYVAKLAAELAGRDLIRKLDWTPQPSGLPNHLATAAIFPVYPEIAEAHRLHFSGSYAFKPAAAADLPNSLDLDAFLASEYESFDRVGIIELSAHPQVRLILKNMEHVY